MTAEEQWFTVTEPATVIGDDGRPAGQLRPGTRYHSLGVNGSVVTIPGPSGSTGRVDLVLVEWETPATPDPEPAPAPVAQREPEPIAQPIPTAGWFPDPEAPTERVRYWDGREWSQHHAPSAAVANAMAKPLVDAGWYADPQAPNTQVRYWDGGRWTEHNAQR